METSLRGVLKHFRLPVLGEKGVRCGAAHRSHNMVTNRKMRRPSLDKAPVAAYLRSRIETSEFPHGFAASAQNVLFTSPTVLFPAVEFGDAALIPL